MKFSDEIDEFINKIEEVKVVVREFDKALSLKANKSQMVVFM